uniref:Uncharacterized protein n=1 Tax=Arundo donax TaxID=35708 RepID=A0A0A8Z575_ARUDO
MPSNNFYLHNRVPHIFLLNQSRFCRIDLSIIFIKYYVMLSFLLAPLEFIYFNGFIGQYITIL